MAHRNNKFLDLLVANMIAINSSDLKDDIAERENENKVDHLLGRSWNDDAQGKAQYASVRRWRHGDLVVHIAEKKYRAQ